MEKTSEKGPAWAVVEIMGFRKHVGIVSEVQRFGATMMHLEALGPDGTFETHYYGGSSIFGVQPLTEEAARRHLLPKSFSPCDTFAQSKVLPTACEDCGFDKGKHRRPLVLTAGTMEPMARLAVLGHLRGTGAEDTAEHIAMLLNLDAAEVLEHLETLLEQGKVERVVNRWRALSIEEDEDLRDHVCEGEPPL